MGYNSTASTLSLTAKLTPLGRQKLISTNNSLIKTFSLGDSDTNYNTTESLATGQVPASSGSLGVNSTVSNSTTQRVGMTDFLIVNQSGAINKPVSTQSIEILSEIVPFGSITVSGTNLTFNTTDRANYLTDSLVNLFYSFKLPVNTSGVNNFTATTYSNGGYADTAYSGLASSKILVIALNNSVYGECIDGKTIKVILPTSAGTYTIYSTYKGGGTQLNVLDASIQDPAIESSIFGKNVAGLVSDDILTPNGGDVTKSWATGYGTTKPFSLNQKQTYNLQTNSNIGVTADTLVGMAYLDKGFIVITNPTIVNNYTASASTGTTVQFDSVSTNVYQSITCIADRGEFGASTNTSFVGGNIPRFTEVGLFDEFNNLIAIAKTDRQVTKNVNEFLALGIKIQL